MLEQVRTPRRIGAVLALGVLLLTAPWARAGITVQAPPAVPQMLRWSRHIPGDSKPVVLYADDMDTWVEGTRRVILLKGRVWIEHGVAQVRMNQAVIWLDEEAKKREGIYRLEVFAEGAVTVEDGAKSYQAVRGLLDLSTRGEIKLRAYGTKIQQQVLTQDPLYQRALGARQNPEAAAAAPLPPPAPAGPIQRTSFQEPAPPVTGGPAVVPVQPQGPRPPLPWPPPQLPASNGTGTGAPLPQGPGVPIIPPAGPAPVVNPPAATPGQVTAPPPTGPMLAQNQPPANPPWGPAVPDNPGGPPAPPPPGTPPAPPAVPPSEPGVNPPAGPAQGPPGIVPPKPPAPPPSPPPAAPAPGPPRQITIVPRYGIPLQSQSFPLRKPNGEPTGETAVVVTSGVIVTVRNPSTHVPVVDMEADRLVFWTQGDTQKLFNQFRSEQGQTTRKVEFYLAGNVEIREQDPRGSRVLRADQVYYDVSRNVAVALTADLEFTQPGLRFPVHFRGQELDQLAFGQYRVTHGEVFSSQLPSDPGLKIVVADATLEERRIPQRGLFGRPVIDPVTGQQEIYTQEWFDGRNIVFDFENVPVFWLPFLSGDAAEPLGPVKNITVGYNKVFGFQLNTNSDMYQILGLHKTPGTSWDLEADYLSERGPALGMIYDYIGKDMFGIPNRYIGHFQAYGIYDTGTDILGGPREGEPHPDYRGRFTWRQDVQDLPYGFTVQTQLNALSDKNFLEQYFSNDFNTNPVQETFLYVKQQENNWAWTFLAQPHLNNWWTETQFLPKVDGYLLGQSFFNLFTYNAQLDLANAHLMPTEQPSFAYQGTDIDTTTGRFDLTQELSLPFALGPFKVVPYAVLDLTYYTEDLEKDPRGRTYVAGGVRASLPLSRLYPDVQSELFNLHGINHKIVTSVNYYNAHSDTRFTLLPQLDQLNDVVTDQALRDLHPLLPFTYSPPVGNLLANSPLYDPQVYALRQLVDSRIDTRDTIEELQLDIRQRLQTKRGYPGQEHIIDWMTLDLSGTYFPDAQRDNFGEHFAFLQYAYIWNVGDRTAFESTGWVDPVADGPRVFTVGTYINRPDRTNFYIGYRQIDPINSRALTGSVTYIFSPKYAITGSAVYDFSNTKAVVVSTMLTRIGSDLMLSFGLNYNAAINTVSFAFEIYPNLSTPPQRFQQVTGLGPGPLPSTH